MDFAQVLIALVLDKVRVLCILVRNHYRVYFLVEGLQSVDLLFDKHSQVPEFATLLCRILILV
jgi:hypothetical protein